MVNIVGKILDSGKTPIAGELIVTLDAPLVDISDNPDALHVLAPHSFSIVSGVLTGVDIAESQTKNITYHFVVNAIAQQTDYYLPDGTQYTGPVVLQGGNYYTGTFYDSETSQRVGQVLTDIRTPVLDFHAIAPNQATVEFASLIPTGISRDTLPTTVRQVAEILTNDPDYVLAIRGGPRFKGIYSSATYYQRDDAVTYGGSSWIYINDTPKVNETPSLVNTNWQILAQKGDPGGTGGNDTAYNATGWDGATDAPSRNAVRDIIEQLARTTQLSAYALLNSPTFTGNPNTPTPLSTATGTEIINASWARSLFALINSPNLTGNPSAPTQSTTDESGKLATTQYVKNKIFDGAAFCAQKTTDQTLSTGANVLNFNQELIDNKNAFTPSTSTFTAPGDGWYEFTLTCRIERSGGTTISSFLGTIFVGTEEYRFWETSGTQASMAYSGAIQIYLTSGQTAQFKISVNSDGTITNKNTYSNTYLTRCSGKRLFW